jgi:Domain of unknown function (DUF4926)
MKLPHGERANLGTKLADYSLNPLHRDGRNKARVFDAVLGVTLANADVLRDALLNAAAHSDSAEPRGDNGFGDVYIVRFPLTTTKGTATVLSAWIIRHGEDFPRLTTCYIVWAMKSDIHLHDVVALLEELPVKHFETGQPLLLRRGQIGTVVMTYDGTTFEVEFSGPDGRAYALLPVPASKLMVLLDTPENVAA